MEIKYNKNTFCIKDNNTNLLIIKEGNEYYYTEKKCKYKIIWNYYNIKIILEIKNSFNILLLYVILQYHYNVNTIKELVNIQNWDYNIWNIEIVSLNNEELPDHLILLKCFLNLKDKYNIPITISTFENEYKLKIKDKRGLGGERPRELNYKYGFPYFTSSTKKYLHNNERIFICPFPIENINPERKAIINNNINKKCFTCGTCEGDTNIFGNICVFEKGHLTPINYNNTTKTFWQCKWCNTFYKDKIIWNEKTGKPEFNNYAILRDMKKNDLINLLKKLGITSNDLIL